MEYIPKKIPTHQYLSLTKISNDTIFKLHIKSIKKNLQVYTKSEQKHLIS